MNYFDDKQKRLIKAWYKQSLESKDPYLSYMAAWIAFNAICYNLYHEFASIERANIDRQKSKLKRIHERLNLSDPIEVKNAKLEGTLDKWSIDISFPERLFISISNNYTEDIIFNEFVNGNKNWYCQNPTDLFIRLKDSLNKEGRYYVINMAKVEMYNPNADVTEMARKNIIILCEENNLNTIKSVLYQIRCNIFHGEKTPGEINDDKIVVSALPLLMYILEYLVKKYEVI